MENQNEETRTLSEEELRETAGGLAAVDPTPRCPKCGGDRVRKDTVNPPFLYNCRNLSCLHKFSKADLHSE